MGLKTKVIVRVASTQNFEDFKGFSVLNPFSKTLIADIECNSTIWTYSSLDFVSYDTFAT